MSDTFTERILEDEESEQSRERREARKAELEKKRSREEKARALAKKRSAIARKYFRIALIAFLVMLALFGRLAWKIKELSEEKAEKQAAIDDLNKQITELEDTLERVTSPEYIEQEARSQLRMIYPDEVLYVVED